MRIPSTGTAFMSLWNEDEGTSLVVGGCQPIDHALIQVTHLSKTGKMNIHWLFNPDMYMLIQQGSRAKKRRA